MEPNLCEYIENMKDCEDSLCVNCQTSSASAIKKMEELVEMPEEIINVSLFMSTSKVYLIQSHCYFPLDDRVLLDMPFDHPEYDVMAKATVDTFHASYSLFARPPVPASEVNAYIKPLGVLEIDSILLVTRDGVIYLMDKTTKVHRCLRAYCEWIKLTCLFGAIDEPRRTPSCHTVVSLPDFQHDNTHLRRSRFIRQVGKDDFFLELDSGLVDTFLNTILLLSSFRFGKCLKKRAELMLPTSILCSKLIPAITSFTWLIGTTWLVIKYRCCLIGVLQTSAQILEKVLRMAQSQKVIVVGYEPDTMFRPVAVINEYVENPLEVSFNKITTSEVIFTWESKRRVIIAWTDSQNNITAHSSSNEHSPSGILAVWRQWWRVIG